MDILINDFDKFVVQEEEVKEEKMNTIFGTTDYIPLVKGLLYKENDHTIVNIYDNVGYVCSWNKDKTIVMMKFRDKCKVKLYNKKEEVLMFTLETSNSISIFSLLLDFYEVQEIIQYRSLLKKKSHLEDYIF